MIKSKSNLLENRLEFITCHRDKRVSEEGVELFFGQLAFFRNAFVFNEKAIPRVPSDFEMHIPDWIKIKPEILEANNWQKKEAMKYVLLTGSTEKWKTNAAIEVVKIEHKQDLPLFCQTQSMGFSGKKVENDPFFPYMSKSAAKNFDNANHHFYMALLNGTPIGVTLAYYHKGLAGIYSVTTLKGQRGQGAATSLMKKAVDDALEAGMKGITLQTMEGTYAEGFYEKLGFEDVFSTHIYKGICKK